MALQIEGYDPVEKVLKVAALEWNGSSWVKSAGTSMSVGLVEELYDYSSFAYGATTITITYKTGGSGGTTVMTDLLTFTDATYDTIVSTLRTYP